MANLAICLIPECDKQQHARGWCKTHHDRWRRLGDPIAPLKRPSNGAAFRYLNEVVFTHDIDTCLIWPFYRMKNGYAIITIDENPKLVHRLSCEEANGPPPSPEHEAAHSCGSGHLGCVAKRHLSWKTRVQNEADKLVHGTLAKGERHGASKLTEAHVISIRAMAGNVPHRTIAARFGISTGQVGRIIRRENWTHL